MGKQIELTQMEFATLLAGMEIDSAGIVRLAEAATPIIERAAERLKSSRKLRVNLDDPDTLSLYTAKLIAVLTANRERVARGGRLIREATASKKIGLGRSTVNGRPELHKIYRQYEISMSNIRPATVDNDYN